MSSRRRPGVRGNNKENEMPERGSDWDWVTAGILLAALIPLLIIITADIITYFSR